jgi:hypothetical protein
MEACRQVKSIYRVDSIKTRCNEPLKTNKGIKKNKQRRQDPLNFDYSDFSDDNLDVYLDSFELTDMSHLVEDPEQRIMEEIHSIAMELERESLFGRR